MSSEKQELLTTNRKALTINLDGTRYGTIAEIGAGQEVARVFFQAGNASGSIAKTMSAYDMTFSDAIYGKAPRYGTIAEIGAGQEVARVFFQAGNASGSIAKTMSAYDMTFSDAIYGKAPRYVSRERLQTMLHHEYALLKERLSDKRGDRTRFFVFANTVAAKSARVADGHGWLGIRFQHEPLAEPSEIIIHVRMWDKKNVLQQEALGIVGTNLLYGAFYYQEDPEKLITSLVDNVDTDRIEVDMLKLAGPAFTHVDNRLLALYLVKHGLTNAVLFSPRGDMLQPSEAFYNRPILVERGSFRPVTQVNVDMLNCATAQFLQEPTVKGKDIVVLMEITMNNLLADGELDTTDFLSRVDMLGHIGFTVLISNYSEFYRLSTYFRRYTKEMIGIALGINHLLEVFNEKYYEHLDGGILESMGRMFRHAVKLYVYPMRAAASAKLITAGTEHQECADTAPADLVTAKNVHVAHHLRFLYRHLLENNNIDSIAGFNEDHLTIFSRDVLQMIQAGDPAWENLVPAQVAAVIKSRHLLGYAEPKPATAP